MNESIFSNASVIWMIIGVVLLLLELVAPGLIIMFFGIGALITAFTLLFSDISISWQLALFLVTSGISILLLRKSLHKKFFSSSSLLKDELEDEFIGKTAKATCSFENNLGKVEFKGCAWNAISQDDIIEGQLVEIIKKDSITLTVKPIK